jgi:hypothetical protein
MTRSRRALILTTQALLLTAAGCDTGPDASGKVSDIGTQTAALTDSFTTPPTTSEATAVGTDRVFNVWLATTSTGTEVVGQMFNLAGAALGPSRVYTSTAHAKFQPTVAYNGAGKFLVAYNDAYSSTDYDILGFTTDVNGNLLVAMNIDFSTALEQMPHATYISTGINQWLITYERNGPSGGNDLVLAALIDVNGNVGTRATIYSSPNLEVNPQGAYSVSTQRIMFAWTQGNDSMAFVFSSTGFALGAVQTYNPPALHMYEYQSLVYQPNAEGMGLAFLEEEPFVDTGRRIRLFTFNRGCEALSCMNAEVATGITTSSTITDVNGPRLTALNSQYIIHAGQAGPNILNGRNIKFVALSSTGVPTSVSNQFVPQCASALTNKLGLQYYVQAGSNTTATVTNVVYDAFCPNFGKVRGQLENTSFARTSYAVSD